MTPVDVVLVRIEDEDLAIFTQRDMFHFELTRRKQTRRSARYLQCIEMQPAITLPGEDYLAAGSPVQLVLRWGLAVGASHAFGGLPDFAGFAGCRVSNADGPRQSLAMCHEHQGFLFSGNSHERNLL
jgi:hypothetical protein